MEDRPRRGERGTRPLHLFTQRPSAMSEIELQLETTLICAVGPGITTAVMFYVVYGNIPATDIPKDMEDSIGDVRDEEEDRD
ncbi:hypothetical protein C0Q70_02996 [Pomacea canaliculata]|uniref:Uncharacterized protein n=1 Tax=Pomacea canaliculata TaxID=400727 RepID=A0A2T7PRH3_POMCA|nr:hypothetical protein C0Q70_02996 [Pomacea canaliculata]